MIEVTEQKESNDRKNNIGEELQLGLNLRRWRRFKNLKQETLAKQLNISRVSLSNYENGKWKIPHTVLLQSAKELNIGIDILLNP